MISQATSRPAPIRQAKASMPVAYIGIGILEWHGLHNPAGLDGVKADELAKHFASKFGGVVMPPLFWGDNRDDICEIAFTPELLGDPAAFDHTVEICREMGYDKAAIARNGKRSLANGGWTLWETLMVHIFFQLESFDYRCIVPIPGHYPLFDPLERAIAAYRQQGGCCDIFPIEDRMFNDSGTAGDHAAAFETSLMLALRPELVDLSCLSADLNDINIGVMGLDPRHSASAEFGWEIINRFDAILSDHLQATGLFTLQ